MARKKFLQIAGAIAAGLFAVALVFLSMDELVIGPPQIVAFALIAAAIYIGLRVLWSREEGATKAAWEASVEACRSPLDAMCTALTMNDLGEHIAAGTAWVGKWDQCAHRINWPSHLREFPLRAWKQHVGELGPLEESLYNRARGLTIQGNIELGNNRRLLSNTVGQWVMWGRDQDGKKFREYIEPTLREWRNPLVMLAFLEIATAAGIAHSMTTAGSWADLGADYPDIFYNHDVVPR